MSSPGTTPDGLFQDFLAGTDTLRVYADGVLAFKSTEDGLKPMLEYLDHREAGQDITIFDKIAGNAAVLLAVLADCKTLYSPLGSETADRTLSSFGIRHRFERTVPFILARNGRDACPMEALSLGKSPEQFRQALRRRLKGPASGPPHTRAGTL